MRGTLRASLISAALAITVIATSSSTAAADGGLTIAGALTVAFSEQLFGTTVGAPVVTNQPSCNSFSGAGLRSFWNLPVVTGDKLTFDWEVATDWTCLVLYPAGTTDFTIDTGITPALNASPTVSLKTETTFVAPKSGPMPLVFHSLIEKPGAYNFTVFVKHGVRLQIPRFVSLLRRGTLNVSVHDPAGGAIAGNGLVVDLRAALGHLSRKIGSATVNGTTVHVAYSVPAALRHHKVALRAEAHGANYLKATSNTVRATAR